MYLDYHNKKGISNTFEERKRNDESEDDRTNIQSPQKMQSGDAVNEKKFDLPKEEDNMLKNNVDFDDGIREDLNKKNDIIRERFINNQEEFNVDPLNFNQFEFSQRQDNNNALIKSNQEFFLSQSENDIKNLKNIKPQQQNDILNLKNIFIGDNKDKHGQVQNINSLNKCTENNLLTSNEEDQLDYEYQKIINNKANNNAFKRGVLDGKKNQNFLQSSNNPNITSEDKKKKINERLERLRKFVSKDNTSTLEDEKKPIGNIFFKNEESNKINIKELIKLADDQFNSGKYIY